MFDKKFGIGLILLFLQSTCFLVLTNYIVAQETKNEDGSKAASIVMESTTSATVKHINSRPTSEFSHVTSDFFSKLWPPTLNDLIFYSVCLSVLILMIYFWIKLKSFSIVIEILAHLIKKMPIYSSILGLVQSRNMEKAKSEIRAIDLSEESKLERRNKGLTLSLEKRIDSLLSNNPTSWSNVFRQQLADDNHVREKLDKDCKLIVIASGKGGVGKSFLSLGLTEAFAQDSKRTLLVDFDLHNRGLTSLLNISGASDCSSSVFSELSLLDSLLLSKGKELAHDTSLKEKNVYIDDIWVRTKQRSDAIKYYSAIEGEKRNVNLLLELYSGIPGEAYKRELEWGRLPFAMKKLKIDGADIPNDRIGFLASLGKSERFLGSNIFEIDYVQIYYFFLCLQYFATRHKYDRVIIDCHGAHDQLMIGALHAASGLLIVSTPEPGGFDGTYELVAFSQLLKNANSAPLPTYLAFNNYKEWQSEAVEKISEFLRHDNSLVNQIFKIPTVKEMSVMSGTYQMGMISEIPEIWNNVVEIRDKFEAEWGVAKQMQLEKLNAANGQ